ncbi:hypothetical protein Nepgr_028018 [Nepenthes gracilis]|uniref:Glycosyltransferase 61 catalytic domain-containing protein n=1 Tax=Nepenthes gracilis TaxID=150966 RepID=A0AAD3Y3I7_NEPGR|nr:hypothetical protein Nepgr_028018 [Nepenthes gracilis]
MASVVAKQRRYSAATVITYLIFLALSFILLLCHLSSIWKSNLASSTKSQDQDPHWGHETSPQPSPAAEISCDRSHYHFDICKINGPTIMDPTTSTFFVNGPAESRPITEKIRPYPRKWENSTMSRIKEVSLVSGPISPQCHVSHNAPALVFSAGGYTGNFFHEFNDGIIPLFITVNSLFSSAGQDLVLVIEKSRDWWITKYADLFRSFTKYPIVNLNNETSNHCFTSVTVGLISHGFMTIDPKLLPNSLSLFHFRAFLDQVYELKIQNHNSNSKFLTDKPTLILISRIDGIGRVILNQDQVKSMAEEAGFNVVVFEPTVSSHLKEAYALINQSQVMVGVHGAGLTHFLFLRPGSVFIQVVPIGVDWAAEVCFGKPAREMGLEYMEYKIRVEESSLKGKYGKDDKVLKDPSALQLEWSSKFKDIYLKEQNVKVDLVRFKGYLDKAYIMAKR